jgi:predicted NUDIX family NTP pyrophosphohydrolase
MTVKSAGILAYRLTNGFPEVFLGHPGGPFNAKKDLGVWSIPKGEFETEKPLAAANREFFEETGFKVSGKFVELRPVKQRSGKMVYAWAVETDLDASAIKSNTFFLAFPGGSGRGKEYPELDRAEWFDMETAKTKILPYQLPFLAQLGRILRESEAV